MNDDVYEFKSSPEDNAASMLLNPDAVRATTNSNYMSSNFETRYGLDEEADLMDEDEGNLIGTSTLMFYTIIFNFLNF